MHSRHPELTAALGRMLDKLHGILQGSGYDGQPIRMFLAGGMAAHFYCGTRYTEDVDASFSARFLFTASDLVVDYERQDKTRSLLYFDANYNENFGLIHPDYREDAVEWQGIGNEERLVHLHVLTPVDLAVSKISRFGEQDQDDILALASRRLITPETLKKRAEEAMEYYVGNLDWPSFNLREICQRIAAMNFQE
jgi:hypothetical protein